MHASTESPDAATSPLDVQIPLGEVPGVLLRRWRSILAAGGLFVGLVLVAAVVDYSTSVYHIVSRLEVTRQDIAGEAAPLADPEVLADELRDPAVQAEVFATAGLEGGEGGFNRILAVEAVDEITVQVTMTAADIEAALALERASRQWFSGRSAEMAADVLEGREKRRNEWAESMARLEALRQRLRAEGVDERALAAIRSFEGHLADHVRDSAEPRVRTARLASVPVIYGEWQGEKYLQYGWISLAGLFVGVFWGLYSEGRFRAAAGPGPGLAGRGEPVS